MRLKIPALVGTAVGLAGAITAAGVAYERKQITQQRARINPAEAASFGNLPSDRTVTVTAEDGVSLHVEEVGPLNAAVTVVFVHGFTLSLGSFHFQRLALAAEFGDAIRMVFYDQRSHGRSARSPAADCTLEQLGRDLGTVIEQRVPSGRIVLVGHSMGGMTVMTHAFQQPDQFGAAAEPAAAGRPARVSSVVLINTSSGQLATVTLGLPSFVARWRGPVLPVVLRRAAKNVHLVERGRAVGKDIAWVITQRLSFGPGEVDPAVLAYCTAMISATPVDVVADFYPTLMAHDGALGLMNLRDCQVLVIGAGHDALTPLSHSESIAAALPDAELVVVEDGGHLLMLEYPDTVTKPLLAWVAAALEPGR